MSEDKTELELIQIGEKCPHCKNEDSALKYIGNSSPFSDEHLWCDKCNSTFLIKYKQMWQEDINGLTVNLIDVIEEEFKKRGMVLTDEKSDILFDEFVDLLDKFGAGDYRNYN